MPVLLQRCNLSKADFRSRGAQCFCHISLYGSSNSSILEALELVLNEASDFQLLPSSTYLIKFSKLMKIATLFLRFSDGDA
jgi:hypothetical protein